MVSLKFITGLIFPVIFFAPITYASCFVGIPDDCPAGKVCAKYNKAGDSKCIDIPKVAPIVFDLPFDESSKVYCTQSGRLSTATHVYQNMLYAIDLASDYKSSTATVYASEPGKAYVHTGCKNPAGKPEQTKVDDCGLGYGNHVFLLHDDGYISIYAHLSDVFVKNGELIKARQSIGIEGATGQAAHRHLHWDVHKLEGTKADWEKVLSQPGWGGYSVPYRFRVKINGTEKIVNSSEIACRWLDQTQAPWTGSYRGLKTGAN